MIHPVCDPGLWEWWCVDGGLWCGLRVRRSAGRWCWAGFGLAAGLGTRPGAAATESAGLGAARCRVAGLEAGLVAVRQASELFSEGRVVRSRDLFSVVAQLGVEGRGVKSCCGLLGIVLSGLLWWRSELPSVRDIRRAWLADLIVGVWEQSRRTYRKRRIRAELEDACGEVVNAKLISRIMQDQGVSGLPERCRREPSGSNEPVRLSV